MPGSSPVDLGSAASPAPEIGEIENAVDATRPGCIVIPCPLREWHIALFVIDPVDPRVLWDRHVDRDTAMPYMWIMHTVMWTSTFLRQAEQLNLSEDELDLIILTLSSDPRAGDMIIGTGGARKLRHPGKGKGKSGGLRTIHYFCGDDVPVFLLSVYSKGTKGNLTKGERNELAALLAELADSYRANA